MKSDIWCWKCHLHLICLWNTHVLQYIQFVFDFFLKIVIFFESFKVLQKSSLYCKNSAKHFLLSFQKTNQNFINELWYIKEGKDFLFHKLLANENWIIFRKQKIPFSSFLLHSTQNIESFFIWWGCSEDLWAFIFSRQGKDWEKFKRQ